MKVYKYGHTKTDKNWNDVTVHSITVHGRGTVKDLKII